VHGNPEAQRARLDREKGVGPDVPTSLGRIEPPGMMNLLH